MASAAGPSRPKATQRKKKTGYFVFMEERKLAVEASLGSKLTMSDLAEALSDDWKNLSAAEKEGYTVKAKAYNDKMKGETPRVQVTPKPKEEDRCDENRAIVMNMFADEKWVSQSIVVCCFSTYFEPALVDGEKYTPAEIGLTAFSLMAGVTDNFARIIDPGNTIPKAKEFEALDRVDELGIPAIGTCDQLQHYKVLTSTIKRFLEPNSSRGQDDDFYIFAFNSDLEKTKMCLDWIFEAAGTSIPVKVLDLSLYTHLASTVNKSSYRSVGEEENPAVLAPEPTFSNELAATDNTDVTFLEPISKTPSIAANRSLGEPFNNCFIYPPAHPMTCYGVFPNEACVDEAIKFSDNYRYYDELCCVYHMKIVDGSHFCALNTSNRYAFSLLEILTMSNKVDLIRGAHYPTVHDSGVERQRRWRLLCRWGITELEHRMKDDDDAVLEQSALNERHQRLQRRLLVQQRRDESHSERVEAYRHSLESRQRFTDEWRSRNEKKEEAERLWPWAKQ